MSVSPGDGPVFGAVFGTAAMRAIIGERDVWFPEAGAFVHTPIYSREKLAPGNLFTGPAIVEQMDEAVSRHLRDRHAPARNGRKSAG